jgi:hypothetical protein
MSILLRNNEIFVHGRLFINLPFSHYIIKMALIKMTRGQIIKAM